MQTECTATHDAPTPPPLLAPVTDAAAPPRLLQPAQGDPQSSDVASTAPSQWQARAQALEEENARLAAEVERLQDLAAAAAVHTQQSAARQHAEQLKQVRTCCVCVGRQRRVGRACISHVCILTQAGNNAFHQQQYAAAIQHYDDAIALGVADARMTAVLHCNKAAALHEQGQYVDAVVQCCMAESHDPGYARAFQRRAEAYAALGDYAAALRVCVCEGILWVAADCWIGSMHDLSVC